MSAAAGGRTPDARSSAIRETLWRTGWWTVLTTIADVGVALLLGSIAWWLGWTRPPIKTSSSRSRGSAERFCPALLGVSVVTLAALALAIGLGTAVYVFLFFEE